MKNVLTNYVGICIIKSTKENKQSKRKFTKEMWKYQRKGGTDHLNTKP